MKDIRHEHPLDDPEHLGSCVRCKNMDLLGESFESWLDAVQSYHKVPDETVITFLILFLANATLDGNPEMDREATRALFLREAGALFDVAAEARRQE